MFYIIFSSGSPRLDAMASCGQQLGAVELMALLTVVALMVALTAVALMVACCCGIDSSDIYNVTGDGGSVGDCGSGRIPRLYTS